RPVQCRHDGGLGLEADDPLARLEARNLHDRAAAFYRVNVPHRAGVQMPPDQKPVDDVARLDHTPRSLRSASASGKPASLLCRAAPLVSTYTHRSGRSAEEWTKQRSSSLTISGSFARNSFSAEESAFRVHSSAS